MTEHDATLPIDPDALPTKEPIWDIALVVALGGAIGGGARYLINTAIPWNAASFPWNTFIENAVGSFLLGVLMVFVLEVWEPQRYTRPFLGVGVLGGFTTFSGYVVEINQLVDHDAAPTGILYLFASLLVGLTACWAGLELTRKVAT